MLRVRARDNSCFVALCNMVGGPGRARSSTATRSSSTTRASWSPAPPSFEEALLVVDVDPTSGGRAAAARRAPAGAARDRVARRGPDGSSCRRSRQGAASPHAASRSTTSSRCGSRSSSGCATTSDKNGFREVVVGLSGGIDSALTAAIARRGARRRARARRLDAVALLLRRRRARDAAAGRESLGVDFREIAIEPIVEAVRRRARAVVRGRDARPDRGEPAGARARARC